MVPSVSKYWPSGSLMTFAVEKLNFFVKPIATASFVFSVS